MIDEVRRRILRMRRMWRRSDVGTRLDVSVRWNLEGPIHYTYHWVDRAAHRAKCSRGVIAERRFAAGEIVGDL